MYESPINIIQGQMETSLENDIMSVVQRYGIDVNKDALICALQYDRNQYEKGYKEGVADYLTALFDKEFILAQYGINDIDRQFLAMVNPSQMMLDYAAYKERQEEEGM